MIVQAYKDKQLPYLCQLLIEAACQRLQIIFAEENEIEYRSNVGLLTSSTRKLLKKPFRYLLRWQKRFSQKKDSEQEPKQIEKFRDSMLHQFSNLHRRLLNWRLVRDYLFRNYAGFPYKIVWVDSPMAAENLCNALNSMTYEGNEANHSLAMEVHGDCLEQVEDFLLHQLRFVAHGVIKEKVDFKVSFEKIRLFDYIPPGPEARKNERDGIIPFISATYCQEDSAQEKLKEIIDTACKDGFSMAHRTISRTLPPEFFRLGQPTVPEFPETLQGRLDERRWRDNDRLGEMRDFFIVAVSNAIQIDTGRYVFRMEGAGSFIRRFGTFVWPYRRFAIFSKPPLSMSLDEKGRLHNTTGPAVVYADGWKIWAIRGIVVRGSAIESPETITLDDIANDTNSERRRVLVDLYGRDRFINENGAELIHEDLFGKLYRVLLKEKNDLAQIEEIFNITPQPDFLTLVEVTNSTAEPDGTYKSYFLRVPPWMTTAKQAVAWTFGMTAEEYLPDRET